MAYALPADLETRFSAAELQQLTDRENIGAIDAGVVAEALADADSEIDSYIGARYVLPLVTVPEVLVACACDIARYYLYEDHPTKTVIRRYEKRLAWLKLVADPKSGVELPGQPERSGEGSAGSSSAEFSSSPSVFSRGAGDF